MRISDWSSDVCSSDLFAELWLDGKWVKATPAFNIELCEKFRVLPLEFDGETDSVFHPFDADNRRHMEYVADRGSFADQIGRASCRGRMGQSGSTSVACASLKKQPRQHIKNNISNT